MKEVVVISGKGGTGKTSMVASFAGLAKNAVFADCDVDAADLHLVLEPKIRQESDFSGDVISTSISILSRGLSLGSRGWETILSATFIPWITSPKTV